MIYKCSHCGCYFVKPSIINTSYESYYDAPVPGTTSMSLAICPICGDEDFNEAEFYIDNVKVNREKHSAKFDVEDEKEKILFSDVFEDVDSEDTEDDIIDKIYDAFPEYLEANLDYCY